MRAVYALGAALLASQASAATLSKLLFVRQTPDLLPSIPQQCQGQCKDFADTLTRCSSITAPQEAVDCLCRESTFDDLDDCFECLYDLSLTSGDPETVKQYAQLAKDQLESGCRAAGAPAGDSDDDDDDSSTISSVSTRSRSFTETSSVPTTSISQVTIGPSRTTGTSQVTGTGDDNTPSNGDSNSILPGAATHVTMSLGALIAAGAGAFLLI